MNKHGRMGTKMSRCLFQVFALLCALAASSAPASSLYFVHTDHLGTPQKITDGGQQVVWEGNPMPFGETEVVVNQIDFHVRFPGQYFDGEGGLHYNYFRDYDPSWGRYLQSDPIGLQGGINTYAYVGGNPLSFTDPQGTARQGGNTGKWWEFTDRNFQRWFHQCVKQPGDQDATREDLADAYTEWVQHGKPDGKNGCGGPPPAPASAEDCDACQNTATIVIVGGAAYVVYRCLRMVPSLFPPLWPTIPANAVVP